MPVLDIVVALKIMTNFFKIFSKISLQLFNDFSINFENTLKWFVD